MTAYELMIETNHRLIKGDEPTQVQKAEIISQLLSWRTSPMQARKFYNGVRLPDNIDAEGRRMYPMYYIPPYGDGGKLKTVLGQTPKTQIFATNMYELEILRLLHILAPADGDVQAMIQATLRRLRTTCFGSQDDGMGECFDASLVVLRFLGTVSSDEVWIQSRIDNYNTHASEKKRPWYAKWYFWLCLSELPFGLAQPEIEPYKNEILNRLGRKSCVMNSETDKIVHPVLLCILRNMMAGYPEYAYIKNRVPYVNEKDGRLYFDMEAI